MRFFVPNDYCNKGCLYVANFTLQFIRRTGSPNKFNDVRFMHVVTQFEETCDRFNVQTEPLEARQLLSVQALDVQVGSGVEQQSKVVTLSWQDDDWTSNSSYEIWINQELGTNRRLSKVYYNQTQVSNAEADQALEQLFAPGKYTAYVRGTTDGVKTLWDSARFEVDTDNDSETPIVLNRPVRPQITSHRIGQGAAGQTISEGALSWAGDAPLYNVWLGRVDENGSVTRQSYIRSVPASHISLREMASFSEDTVYTPFYRRD